MYNLYDENVNIEIILAYESLLISIYEAEKLLASENQNYLTSTNSYLLNTINTSTNNNNNQHIHTSFSALYLKFWTTDMLPKFEKILSESESKNEIVNLLETIYGIIEHIGKELFVYENLILLRSINNAQQQNSSLSENATLSRLVKMLKTLLKNEASCQIVEDASDAEDPDEIDHDEEILANIGNLIVVCAEKLQSEFSTIFEDLYFSSLKDYLNPKTQSEENIAIVFGSVADALCHCVASVKSLSQDLLALINENYLSNAKNTQKKSSCKKYKDPEVLKNVAYLIGVLFASDSFAMQSHLEPCLALLFNLLPYAAYAAQDNIIAALAKISNSQKIENFEKLFFAKGVLQPILANIPLTADPRLNANVFAFFENLVLNEACVVNYLEFFEAFVDKVFGFVKFMALNQFVCGIDAIVLMKIKDLLERLSSRSTLFRDKFKMLIENGFVGEEEKDKFNSVFLNL